MNITQMCYPVGRGKFAVSNAVIRDKRLSLKARGILVLLMRKPDFMESGKTDLICKLSQECPQGRTSCRSGLQELIDAGYIPEWSNEINPVLGQLGKPGYVYVMHEPSSGLHKSPFSRSGGTSVVRRP